MSWAARPGHDGRPGGGARPADRTAAGSELTQDSTDPAPGMQKLLENVRRWICGRRNLPAEMGAFGGPVNADLRNTIEK